MARGLVMWTQLHDSKTFLGPTAVVYCHQSDIEHYRPHEAAMLHAWGRAVNAADRSKRVPEELRPTTTEPLELPLTVGVHQGSGCWATVGGITRWQLQRGIRLLQGNWWAWNEAHKVGVLIGTNTTEKHIMEMIESCIRRLADLHGWRVIE